MAGQPHRFHLAAAGARTSARGSSSSSFQSPERTLSDEDAQVVREQIVSALAAAFGAELRG